MRSSFKEGPSPTSGQGLTRALFVRRLARLIRLRRDYSEDLNPLGLRLLDRAIQSTYKDCLDYGASEEVKQLIAQHPVPGWDKDI
jgi:hypothetical protein